MKKNGAKVLQQIGLSILLLLLMEYTVTAQYTLTDNDVVVTGGIIESCSYDFAIKDIIIPSTLDGQTVTGIADRPSINLGVFYNKGITSLALPSTLTSIGNCAFNTNEITSLDVSSCTDLTTIGGSAFYYNSITSLNFSNCTNLISIGEAAFIWNDISSLNLTIPTLESIGESAFSHNELITLNLSSCTALVSIGANAFYDNHDASYSTYLTNFDLPTPNITGYILDYWEDGSSNQYLGGATVSDLATSYTANLIEAYNVTFTITDGTDPISGATVSLSGYGTVLSNASGVATFSGVVPASNISYSVSASSYSTENSTVSVVNANVNKTVTLSFLTTYTLTDADVVVTDGVIQSCSYDFAIKNIIIPGTLDGQTVVGIKDVNINTDGIFYNKGITSVVFPESLNSIGNSAFSYNLITNVDLSACTALSSIGNYAFYVNSIFSINLPNSLNHMGIAAFNNNQINTVNGIYSNGIFYALNDDGSEDNTTIISYAGASDDVIIPSQVEVVEDNGFYGNYLTSVDLSACTNLTFIGQNAFRANSLTSIDLSNCTSLVTIKNSAFRYNSLTTI